LLRVLWLLVCLPAKAGTGFYELCAFIILRSKITYRLIFRKRLSAFSAKKTNGNDKLTYNLINNFFSMKKNFTLLVFFLLATLSLQAQDRIVKSIEVRLYEGDYK
jgi:lauroyl/myristoyl acyltransferase